MTLTQPIIDRLLTDTIFRRETGIALGVNENTVKHLAVENRPNNNLTKIAAIYYFKSKGYSEKQILEKEKTLKSA